MLLSICFVGCQAVWMTHLLATVVQWIRYLYVKWDKLFRGNKGNEIPNLQNRSSSGIYHRDSMGYIWGSPISWMDEAVIRAADICISCGWVNPPLSFVAMTFSKAWSRSRRTLSCEIRLTLGYEHWRRCLLIVSVIQTRIAIKESNVLPTGATCRRYPVTFFLPSSAGLAGIWGSGGLVRFAGAHLGTAQGCHFPSFCDGGKGTG